MPAYGQGYGGGAYGQYGAALSDCRGVWLGDNEAVRNGQGAVSGMCDEVGVGV